MFKKETMMQGMGWSARVWTAMLAGALGVATAWGDVSFDKVTWSTGDTLGWVNTDGQAVSVTAPASGGNAGGYLSETFGPTDPPVPQTDHLVNIGAGYVGDFVSAGVAGLTFDFLGQPGGVQYVYFQGGGSTWEALLNVTSGAWQSYNMSFTDPAQWTKTSGGASFETALADVTLVGFDTTFMDTGAPFQYGLDNWQYQQQSENSGAVPEPETVSFALTLLATAGLLFGRRVWRGVQWIHPLPGKP